MLDRSEALGFVFFEDMNVDIRGDFSIAMTEMFGNNKKLKQILVNNDMPSLSVHGLRHSNASLLINNGYDVKAISEHLGHCNTEITSNIYVHIFKEYKAKMAESIEHDLL